MRNTASFLAFYLAWADLMRWKVPDIHVRACHWFEHCGDLAVLRCFRGFSKSTILGVYNAWRYWRDPSYRILHQSEADGTAYKTSRHTQAVLRRHPWCKGMLSAKAGPVEQWWVSGAQDIDSRNASMYAKGILSNVTSARADECQNDDVEVPRNIQTPEAREKLRYRLGEQTHILVPGGRTKYIGTPHTHDSLYDEQQALGADCLTIRMFDKEQRIDVALAQRYAVPFRAEFVFAGIGKATRLLTEGKDYVLTKGGIELLVSIGGLVDVYSGCAWPERFGREELLKRRRKTRTINEWDSQYQLHSKPIHEVRLNPDHMIEFAAKPTIHYANRQVVMMLGKVQIVGAAARWDCSLGKINSDASAFCLILTDAAGRLYWLVAEGLEGELEDQCARVKALVLAYHIPRVVVETNGPGGFVPAALRKALMGTGCAVADHHSSENKQKRILDSLEPALSMRILWAHTDVLDGPTYDQMKDFNPALKNQPDDYLDAAAGAIADTPVRIGRIVGIPPAHQREDWRPSAGSFEAVHEMD